MLKKNVYFYALALSFLPFTAQSEIFEEEYTVSEAEEVYQRSDEEKIQDPDYQPEKDSDKYHLNQARRFVLNGDIEVRYYALQEGVQPTLFFLNPEDSNVFRLSKAYQQDVQHIQITPQLSHHVSTHELFSVMPLGKNIALFFQTQYYYTPEERQHNYALTPLFEPYDRRSSYELLEVTPEGKILHQAKFVAPSPENGMSLGADYADDDEIKAQSEYSLTYQTSTPGDYEAAKPYDLEIAYVYKNGQLHRSEEKKYLTMKDYEELKRTTQLKNFENEELDLYGYEENLQSTNCLDDYFTYQDKAAPKDATWGNSWLQGSPKYQKFLSDYQKGQSYTWQGFKQNFCPPVTD